jgi:pimeloyl-ACP methyl ester carboxylesterase
MADDLHHLLEHLGDERVHLIGHSFGGGVALHYTVLHPERVRSLTLADARVPALQPPLQPRGAEHWKRLNARLRRAGIELPENLPRVAYSLFEDLAHLRRSPSVTEQGHGDRMGGFLGARTGNSRAMQRWTQLMRTTTAHRDLEDPAGLTVEQIRGVKQPTLAIFGRRSTCLPTLRGLKQCIPHCRSILISNAGHFHPVLKPEGFVKHVEEFIGRVEIEQQQTVISGSG